jgi:hypothetical protein
MQIAMIRQVDWQGASEELPFTNLLSFVDSLGKQYGINYTDDYERDHYYEPESASRENQNEEEKCKHTPYNTFAFLADQNIPNARPDPVKYASHPNTYVFSRLGNLRRCRREGG